MEEKIVVPVVSQPDPEKEKAAAELKRLAFNENAKYKMRCQRQHVQKGIVDPNCQFCQRRATKEEKVSPKTAAIQELIREAKEVVFVGNDPKRKDQIKQGHSLEAVELYEYEVEQAVGLTIACAQATNKPASLFYDHKKHVWYPRGYPAAHRIDWWSDFGYEHEILHECDFDNDATPLDDLADLQIDWSETAFKYRKVAINLRAGYKTDKLLNPLWMDRDLSNRTAQLQPLTRMLKSVESYLTASGITNLWVPEQSRDPREIDSWWWTKPETSESAESRLPHVPVTIRPSDVRVVESKPDIPRLLGVEPFDAKEVIQAIEQSAPSIVKTVDTRLSLVDRALGEINGQ
jgi:hypothetical protein